MWPAPAVSVHAAVGTRSGFHPRHPTSAVLCRCICRASQLSKAHASPCIIVAQAKSMTQTSGLASHARRGSTAPWAATASACPGEHDCRPALPGFDTNAVLAGGSAVAATLYIPPPACAAPRAPTLRRARQTAPCAQSTSTLQIRARQRKAAACRSACPALWATWPRRATAAWGWKAPPPAMPGELCGAAWASIPPPHNRFLLAGIRMAIQALGLVKLTMAVGRGSKRGLLAFANRLPQPHLPVANLPRLLCSDPGTVAAIVPPNTFATCEPCADGFYRPGDSSPFNNACKIIPQGGGGVCGQACCLTAWAACRKVWRVAVLTGAPAAAAGKKERARSDAQYARSELDNCAAGEVSYVVNGERVPADPQSCQPCTGDNTHAPRKGAPACSRVCLVCMHSGPAGL